MQETNSYHVTIEVGDGTEMVLYISHPTEGGPFPGVILFQEIFGVNQHIRNVTNRLAQEGYLVAAPDIFHRSSPGFDIGYEDLKPGFEQASALTAEGLAADIQATYDWLVAHEHVNEHFGSLGFCLGGRLSFIANTLVPLKAAVSYYAGGMESQIPRVSELKAPMLFFWASQDMWIPAETHQQLTAALRQNEKPFVSVEFGQSTHGFACDARDSFNPEAAAQAWALTLAFLKTHLQPK